MSFVHLHVHSEYSLLDGACRIEDLARRAKELGQGSIAITDHGVMYGAVNFYKEAKKQGVKPIIGCEVYVAPRTRHDKEHGQDSSGYHLVLLCKDDEGYRNLCYMVSCAFTEGFYVRPRIDTELLRAHSKGIIALSACLAGEIPRLIMNGNYEGAKSKALELNEIFGAGNFYLEIQDHGISEQKEVNSGIIRIHKETGIPLVATNDVHYVRREDAYNQDVLMCIQTGKTLDDPDRMKFETQEFYIKSEEEMRGLFPQCPEACDNTVKISEMCNMDFEFGHYHLPEFKVPEGCTSVEYLEKLCQEGFEKRYSSDREDVKKQLKYELDMINKMGFTDYFLIVSDFVCYAKEQGIPVGPGRGSAAGSVVSYCLNITDIDPMEYSLYFERFLNPERISMPDIDMDFCVNRRSEVIDYVNQKYGNDHVAQIVTFGTMAAKGAIRDVARVMNISYAEADTVAKLVPNTLNIKLSEALKVSKQLRDMYEADERIKQLIDTAMAIEGMPRHASTHAAGVVITKRPVYEYVPLAKNDESVVCQYTMTTLEELGLLKMDFLGLRNLTVLHDAVHQVQKTVPEFTLDKIPMNDKATFDMLSQGKTVGVFQMESAGITAVCTGLKPGNIEDITAIIALYRPGPMDSIPRFIECKSDPSKIVYKHPMLRDILDITYGCIVYQEQVIEIFRKLGGFSLGQADMMRRAISKKKQKEILKEKHAFIYGDESRNICGAVANGIDAETAESIYKEIEDFANYAFNKAHAVSYAVISYQTAYLKCHYPHQYMAALLTSVLENTAKVAEYIADCKENGIKLLPPDINESDDCFTVIDDNIRFGLVAVKNIGRGFIKDVMQERSLNGKFISFDEFCERMYGKDINRRAIESLIKCGAFDSTGAKRRQLMEVCSSVLEGVASEGKRNIAGQMDLFGSLSSEEEDSYRMTLPNVPEYSPMELMTMEKETTGLYMSGHPMDTYKEIAKKAGAVSIGDIMTSFEERDNRFHDDQYVTIAGIISSYKTKTTRNQSLMAYIELEDYTGNIEMLAFQRVIESSGGYIKENSPVFVTGRISVRDEKAPQLLCDTIRPLKEDELQINRGYTGGTPQYSPPMQAEAGPEKVYIKTLSTEDKKLEKLKLILEMFVGTSQIIIYFADTKKRLGASCLIHPSLVAELKEMFGDENIVVK